MYRDDTFSYYEGVTCELNNMFVESKYRGLGVGTKLINSFVCWCRERNAKRIFVTASIGNDKTIKFYRNLGFNDLNITLKKDL